MCTKYLKWVLLNHSAVSHELIRILWWKLPSQTVIQIRIFHRIKRIAKSDHPQVSSVKACHLLFNLSLCRWGMFWGVVSLGLMRFRGRIVAWSCHLAVAQLGHNGYRMGVLIWFKAHHGWEQKVNLKGWDLAGWRISSDSFEHDDYSSSMRVPCPAVPMVEVS